MYHVWWPWLASKRVARVCQHQLSFLLIPGIGNFLNYGTTYMYYFRSFHDDKSVPPWHKILATPLGDLSPCHPRSDAYGQRAAQVITVHNSATPKIDTCPTFGLFAIFDRNLANIVAPTKLATKIKLRKSDHFGKKHVKTRIKIINQLVHKTQRNEWLFELCNPGTHSEPDRSVTEKTNTTFSHLQPARVVRFPNFACW